MGLSELSKVAPVREAGGRPDGAWGGARPHFLAHIWQRLSLARANTCKRLNSVLLLTLAIKHMTTLPCSHIDSDSSLTNFLDNFLLILSRRLFKDTQN